VTLDNPAIGQSVLFLKGADMDDDQPPPFSEVACENEAQSPRAQIAGLVTDVRNLAEAEWEYARARLSYSGGVVRKAGIYALLAILAVSGASIALILGIMMIIASYWGPWLATVITVIVFSIVALLFAVRARATARNLSFSNDE
jgi:Putative Actinobacterial Holin-X, holin superfamily III